MYTILKTLRKNPTLAKKQKKNPQGTDNSFTNSITQLNNDMFYIISESNNLYKYNSKIKKKLCKNSLG